MFFYPYLYNARPASVSVLCLSTGNFDGLGTTRKMEMQRSCDRIASIKTCSVLEHPELQDGMDKRWAPEVVSREVGKFVESHGIKTILTFDDYGVSFHPNHIDVSRGVKHYALEKERTTRTKLHNDSIASKDDDERLTVVMLRTTAWIRKFIGGFDILITNLSKRDEGLYISGNPLRCLHALTAHWSQMVWFRWLWCFFSRYCTVNSFYAVWLKRTHAHTRKKWSYHRDQLPESRAPFKNEYP